MGWPKKISSVRKIVGKHKVVYWFLGRLKSLLTLNILFLMFGVLEDVSWLGFQWKASRGLISIWNKEVLSTEDVLKE